jgi:hypothetical protein
MYLYEKIQQNYKSNYVKKANMRCAKMTEDEFARTLKESLKENLSVSLSIGNSYGYGDMKVLTVHIMFNGETVCLEEIGL